MNIYGTCPIDIPGSRSSGTSNLYNNEVNCGIGIDALVTDMCTVACKRLKGLRKKLIAIRNYNQFS